jgi:methylmalonyl-CoA mutase C-terminal domain/subunit
MVKKRVLMAKMGMDGHDVGMKVVSKMLQNEGFEIVYLGPYQSPKMILNAAIQETVDIIAIGSHSGEYEYFVPELLNALREANLDEKVSVVLAGLIAESDTQRFKDMGLDHVFPIGTSLSEVEEYFRTKLAG